MKKFINWLEENGSRTRKVVLLTTISLYLLLTSTIIIAGLFGVIITSNLVSIFVTLSGLVATVYGFFTGTSSEKQKLILEKGSDIILDKINEIENSSSKPTSKKPSYVK
jgi:hypothetical protein